MGESYKWLIELFEDSRKLDITELKEKYDNLAKTDIKYFGALQAVAMLHDVGLYEKVTFEEFDEAYKLLMSGLKSGEASLSKQETERTSYIV